MIDLSLLMYCISNKSGLNKAKEMVKTQVCCTSANFAKGSEESNNAVGPGAVRPGQGAWDWGGEGGYI